MCIHLYQFRMGETQEYMINPPQLFINVKTIWKINLFWEDGPKWKPVRDIYRLEFDVFQSFGWCFFYVASVAVFSTHMCLGWQKCVPAPSLDIPKPFIWGMSCRLPSHAFISASRYTPIVGP